MGGSLKICLKRRVGKPRFFTLASSSEEHVLEPPGLLPVALAVERYLRSAPQAIEVETGSF